MSIVLDPVSLRLAVEHGGFLNHSSAVLLLPTVNQTTCISLVSVHIHTLMSKSGFMLV